MTTSATTEFGPLCKLSEIRIGEGKHFRPQGGRWRNKSMAVFEEKGNYYAINYICPHSGGPIGEAKIEDGIIECPWHAWRYHADTGLSADTDDGHSIEVYETKIEGDQLLVGGQANLGGTLRVILIDDFLPAFGQTFEIIQFGTVDGNFESIELVDFPAGLSITLTITGEAVVLEAVAPPLTADQEIAIEDGVARIQDFAGFVGDVPAGRLAGVGVDADSVSNDPERRRQPRQPRLRIENRRVVDPLQVSFAAALEQRSVNLLATRVENRGDALRLVGLRQKIARDNFQRRDRDDLAADGRLQHPPDGRCHPQPREAARSG